jgi:hypothetical protein
MTGGHGHEKGRHRVNREDKHPYGAFNREQDGEIR